MSEWSEIYLFKVKSCTLTDTNGWKTMSCQTGIWESTLAACCRQTLSLQGAAWALAVSNTDLTATKCFTAQGTG